MVRIALWQTLRLRIRSRGRGGRGDRLREWRVGWWQVRGWQWNTAVSTTASATTTPRLVRVKTDSRVRSAGWWGGDCSQCCNRPWFPSRQRFTFAGTDISHVFVLVIRQRSTMWETSNVGRGGACTERNLWGNLTGDTVPSFKQPFSLSQWSKPFLPILATRVCFFNSKK